MSVAATGEERRARTGRLSTAATGSRAGAALRRAAVEDPVLAARAIVMTLPAAAARVRRPLVYDLVIDGVGAYRVRTGEGRANVQEIAAIEAEDGLSEFRIQSDPATLVAIGLGEETPLRLALGGRVRIRGRRRRAFALRAMSKGDEPTFADVRAAGGWIDPGVVYRLLPWLIDPVWTTGHRFTVAYEVTGEGGGRWYVSVRDGEQLAVSESPPVGGVAATATVSFGDFQRIAAGELDPTVAIQEQVTTIEGQIHPLVLLGRWIDRAQGRDDEELEREAAQRERLERRGRLWGAGGRSLDDDGLSIPDLYALWERQNWRIQDLDFSVDREQWVSTPAAAQQATQWSLGSFYVAEERVTADLAPFLAAAPSGEAEVFLATQLADEARHAAFFDRFGGEVMALEGDDFRSRMREVEAGLMAPWRDVFDGALRGVAADLRARPDDLALFVRGIATYHLVLEGFLAVTGQAFIRGYLAEHGMFPGFCRGFELVERDEHRHVAFGVRFLSEAIAQDPGLRSIVESTVIDLAPRAAHVFVPPHADDPADFVSYGYHSSELYGFAYNTLKRRMAILGIAIAPASELMPGPLERAPQPRLEAGAGDAGLSPGDAGSPSRTRRQNGRPDRTTSSSA